MQIQMVTFSAVKDGNAAGEWQDGACGGVAADGSWARFLVLDGATTAYDPVRWVDRKSTRLNSSHIQKSRMPSSA